MKAKIKSDCRIVINGPYRLKLPLSGYNAPEKFIPDPPPPKKLLTYREWLLENGGAAYVLILDLARYISEQGCKYRPIPLNKIFDLESSDLEGNQLKFLGSVYRLDRHLLKRISEIKNTDYLIPVPWGNVRNYHDWRYARQLEYAEYLEKQKGGE